MNPTNPIEWATLPFKKYATFSGRAPRAEYWWFYLLYIIAYMVAGIVDSALGTKFVVVAIVLVAFILPMLAAGVRRLHDTNRTGWWLLAPIVPIVIGVLMAGPALMTQGAAAMAGLGAVSLLFLVGLILGLVVLVFYLLPGTPGENRYGPNPYGLDIATA